MPIFRFLVRGEDAEAVPAMRGFFTTRHARASSRELARQKVVDRILEEFVVGRVKGWSCQPPILVIEDCWEIGSVDQWKAPNRGFTFFDEGL